MSGFNSNMVNKGAAPKGSSLNYRKEPNTTSATLLTVVAKAGQNVFSGRTTGDYFDMTDGRWYRIIITSWNSIAYVREDVTSFVTPATNPAISEKDTQKLIDNLVASDQNVFESILKSSVYLKAANDKKINISAQLKKLGEIHLRLERRQEKMKNSKLLKWQSGMKKGWDSYVKNYTATLQQKKDGTYFIPGTVYGIGSLTSIIIAAVIGAGLLAACYFAFKPSYDESQVDLKISTELEKALSTLTPEEKEKVTADLEKQVDDAYNSGKTAATFETIWKIAKPLAFGVLGFFLITKFIDKQSQKRAQ